MARSSPPRTSIRKSINVGQVLWPPAGLFVHKQIIQADNRDVEFTDISHDPSRVTFFKIHPVNLVENFNPHGRKPHSDNISFLEKQCFISLTMCEPKSSQRHNDSAGVLASNCNPNVHVLRVARHAMDDHGPATDKKILNLLLVEKLQEISEVVRQRYLFHERILAVVA